MSRRLRIADARFGRCQVGQLGRREVDRVAELVLPASDDRLRFAQSADRRRERQLPPVGVLTIEDSETGQQVNIDTNKRSVRERFQELAAKTGRAPDDLVEDAMAGYLQELAQVREVLDSRYDDLKSGRVKPVDGEDAFATLRRKSKNDAGRTSRS